MIPFQYFDILVKDLFSECLSAPVAWMLTQQRPATHTKQLTGKERPHTTPLDGAKLLYSLNKALAEYMPTEGGRLGRLIYNIIFGGARSKTPCERARRGGGTHIYNRHLCAMREDFIAPSSLFCALYQSINHTDT